MRSCRRLVALLGLLFGPFLSPFAGAQSPHSQVQEVPAQTQQVPAGVILVKGAWSSASDSVTPLPEGGKVSNNVYVNPYLGLTYPLAAEWLEKYDGPPPSDSGYYVLAQLGPSDSYQGTRRGTLLIAAQDLFFTATPASTARELIDYTRDNLHADYKVESAPSEVKIAGHSFVRLGYVSPVAGLHWYVLATQIRCHIVEFIFTSPDPGLIASLSRAMNSMKLPAEAGLTSGTGGGEVPVCIKDYASGDNVITRVDAAFSERRFNAIPVRVIIDKGGKVKHVHFLSAFPDQAKGITDALMQWRFKPYLINGQPVEVETGIAFGQSRHVVTPAAVKR